MEPVALADMTEACWELAETEDASIAVETNHEVRADASRLQQLLENLIRNAADHDGEDVTITVGSLPDRFFVEDDGPGIPPEDREVVFEAGYTSSSGTGFGLHIVKQIADAHGWTIQIREGETVARVSRLQA